MKNFTKSAGAVGCILAVTLLIAGCSAPEVQTTRVTVSGNIQVADGVSSDGVVHIALYHAWALDGVLRHPVEFIESFDSEVGSFSVDVDYPVDKGEGLLVYAWIDLDGDGVLCTPTGRNDLAGLTEAEGFPAAEVTVNVWLVAPCAGPDWFFPPATG